MQTLRSPSRALRAALAPVVLLLLAPLAGAALTIADAAPKNSFLVAGCDDVARAKAAFDHSPLKALWDDREFSAWFKKLSGGSSLDPFGMLDAAGVEPDSLSWPKGATGLALFLSRGSAGADGGSPRLNLAPVAQALALADFGDDTAGAEAAIDAMTRLASRGVKDGVATRETLTHEDAEITRIVIDFEALDQMLDKAKGLPAPPPMPKDADPEDAPEDPDYDARSHWEDSPFPHVVLFTRVGGLVLACSDLTTLKETIDRAQGRSPGPSAGESPEFRAALAQHEAGYHAYAVAPGKALGEYITSSGPEAANLAEMAAPGTGMFAEWAERMGGALGLDGVRALSLTARLDASSGPIACTIAALTEEKRGLLTVIDGPAKPLTLPAFVPADASSVLVQRVELAKLLPLLRSAAGSMPPEARDELEGALEAVAERLGPALAALGSDITIVDRVEKPYSADSKRSLYALDVADPAALSQAVNDLTRQFGLAPRDFQGNQIWETPAGGPSIGLGFSRLFLGSPADVESALREAGQPDRAKLAAEPAFQRVVAALGGPGIGFEYVRMRPGLEWMDWRARNLDDLLTQEFNDAGWPPEERAGFLEDVKSQMPAWTKEPLPVDALMRCIGDMGMVVRSTPEGFVMQWLVTKPQ